MGAEAGKAIEEAMAAEMETEGMPAGRDKGDQDQAPATRIRVAPAPEALTPTRA
ncbi:hypothetical protein MAXJ12_30202 [Mesorhizobium alhagi CCNWXJ12-2]|uniref:Uncharacterized protein n=1 Tax=Mesorhizobium alhagi CCNWXJ12-2 TaxID=1107882 RepID=H0I0Q3_9HYPH|nr:hypothetical protein MAXJ12_30202 [Mesorhizobium alhagi CCNWXJ12-2]